MNKLVVLTAPALLCGVKSFAKELTRPNIVVLIADDISRDDFGCYGHPVINTPNIDALSEGGIRFENAILTTSSSGPSRTSIITGRYPHNTGSAELHTPVGDEQPSIAKFLHDGGYYTAQAGKWHFGQSSKIPEGAMLAHFDRTGGAKGDGGGESGAGRWITYLRERPKDKPFFIWFASHDAHRKWDDDDSMKRYTKEEVVVPPYLVDDEATREDLASYYYEVSRFDNSVGKVVAELKRQGVFENTLIIVMADNGRAFVRAKTRMIADGIRPPFIVSYPQLIKEGGVVSEALISAIDIAPTFSEIASVKSSKMFQGKSFLSLLTDSDSKFRNYAFSEHNWHDFEAYERMVTDGRYIYIENSRPNLSAIGAADIMRGESSQSLIRGYMQGTLDILQREIFVTPRVKAELYDCQSDPMQCVNLIDDEPEITATLSSILKKWQQQTDDTLPSQLTPDRYNRTTIEPVKNYQGRGEMPGASSSANYNCCESIF